MAEWPGSSIGCSERFETFTKPPPREKASTSLVPPGKRLPPSGQPSWSSHSSGPSPSEASARLIRSA